MVYSHILVAPTSGMALAISPQVWIDYIENILCGMANKQDYIAIMDDLLIHGLEGNHLGRLEALFQAMIKHGLILSPKKCQLFMKHLVYMGNIFHIDGSTISITLLQSRVEAIQRLQPPLMLWSGQLSQASFAGICRSC